MSDPSPQTLSEMLSKAASEWLAEHGGGYITGMAAAVEYIDEDGSRCCVTAHTSDQSVAHTLGLLRWHTLNVERQCR